MSDRAGISFEGRELPEHPFAGDDGSCPPALAEAMSRVRLEAGDSAEEALVRTVAASRLLVGVVAAPGSAADDPHAGSQMASMTLTGPDGTRAMPVFSSVAALAAWQPGARPMPVTAPDAARAAVQDGCSVMVLDVGGDEVVLRGSMLWALAVEQPWRPAHLDPHVLGAVHDACAPEDAVAWQDLRRGPEGGTVVELGLEPGLGPDDVMALARRVAERIAADGEARARIDALSFGLRKA